MSYRSSYAYSGAIPNKTLKNTLTLLSLTTAFSAVMAVVNMHLGIHVSPIISMIVYFGLIFVLNMVKDSGAAIFVAFGITGWLGFMLGPILNHYLKMSNGYGIIISAFAGTALTFAATSIYAYKKNPTIKGVWMSNLFWISLIAMGLSMVNYYFFHMTILSMIISVVFLAISVIYLTFEMARIFRDEPGINYVLATVGIFVSLYNVFKSLLHILGVVNSRN